MTSLAPVSSPARSPRFTGLRTIGSRIAALATAILAVASFAAAAPEAWDLTAKVPASDYNAVVAVYPKKLAASELFKSTIEPNIGAQAAERLKQLETWTGLLPRRDLDAVVLVGTGAPRDAGRRGLLLARGAWDQAKVLAAAENLPGFMELSRGEATYFAFRGVRRSDREIGLAFLDKTTLVAGPLEDVEDLLDANEAGAAKVARVSEDAQLLALADQVPAEAGAWLIARVAEDGPAPRFVKNNLSSVVGYATLSDAIAVNVKITCKDADRAASVGKMAEGLLQLGRTRAAESKSPAPVEARLAVSEILEEATLKTQGDIITLTVNVDADQVLTLMKARQARIAARRSEAAAPASN